MTFSPRAIEAAARALCVQSGDDPDKLTYAHAMQCTGHDREPKFTWQYWMPFAEAALSAALAVDGVALQGWQDISTAPKDGTRILWSCGDDKMSVIHWPEYDLCFEGGYWMPLPKPPAASDREERPSPHMERWHEKEARRCRSNAGPSHVWGTHRWGVHRRAWFTGDS